jgi:hypothetical protein
MKSFRQLVEENKKSLAILFGRMNPPTRGHEENVKGLKKMAHENGADHLVIASHSHDASKNPLDPVTKLKHLKRAFPDTNIITSSKEKPTIMHQAAEAHKKGYNHLIVAGGGDRVKEYHHLLNKYNGVEGRHGYYKFDHIEVKSTGERKPGISGTDMRNHVKSGNFKEFKKNLPTNIQKNPTHATELFHDVTKGMGLHEDVNHGRNKAIFVSGGPGSGKDIIIRECIAASRIVELNFVQAFDYLADKSKLSQKSKDLRLEAIRTRGPLIINGPADDFDKISYIKEELEELGYKTMMVFVDTTDNVSRERNTLLSRMMVESIRQDRWVKSHQNITHFTEMFNEFVRFDNSGVLSTTIDAISETFTKTTKFLEPIRFVENTQISNRFIRMYESKKDYAKGCGKHGQMLFDNNCPGCQLRAKSGKIDDVRDGDIKSNGTYAFRTYAESKQPALTKNPEPKESRFSMDKDKLNKKSRGDSSLSAARPGRPDGVGSTYDSRGGTAAAGAGLGNQTYSEDKKITTVGQGVGQEFGLGQRGSAQPSGLSPNPLAEKKPFKKFREAIDSPGEVAMGVGGVLGGASNKEPMVTPMDKYGQAGITIKKQKKPGAK